MKHHNSTVVVASEKDYAEDTQLHKDKKKSKTTKSSQPSRSTAISTTSSATNNASKESHKRKLKLAGGDDVHTNNAGVTTTAATNVWTQNQQKIFEWALSSYPKGTSERWEKIAGEIPGKNKVSYTTRLT